MKAKGIVIFYFWSYFVFGQDYSVDSISPSLLEGADAVVRLDKGHFKIVSIDEAVFKVNYAVTLLNKSVEDMGHLFMFYDKLSSVSEIEATLYDAGGKRIKKIKSSDIYDRSAYSGDLFDDSRLKYIDATHSEYPYTLVFSYKKKFKFLYSIPDWRFSGGENTAVEYSSYTLEYPESIGARYMENNFDGEKVKTTSEGISKITWDMENMPAVEIEKYGPPSNETVPNLTFGVSKFSYEGYEGDMSTWDAMAAWQRSLNEGRGELSNKEIEKIRAITEGLSRKEKIRKVYSYMQGKTRYVSIQLGVGGFQPFPAIEVEKNGYGDCKALSFYTQSLLKYVGIDAFYSWVYGGVNPPKVNNDFPQDNFNHIILAVPHENDTIWLECTSQTNPFGYLGYFTGDRKALLINDKGGHLVNTTSYPSEGNKKNMTASVVVTSEGHARVLSNTRYEGILADRMLSRAVWSYDDKKKYLEESIDIPTFEINDFKIEREGQKASREIDLNVNKLFSMSGDRIFLQPNVMNKRYFVPLKYKERKTDIVVRSGFHEYDTVNFEFPSEFRIEAKFDPIHIESAFGIYEASIEADEDGKFQYIRHFMQNKGRFDASQYDEYLNFHKKVVRADKRKIALISGT